MKPPGPVPPRRPRACLSPFGTTVLHPRNPWVAAFWSFAFPGCGHLIQGRKLKGMLFIGWELIVNTKAKVNLAILYGLTGRFDEARAVGNARWFLLYVPLYMYAIWDSYRGTVELNRLARLADREDAPLPPYRPGALDLNAMDKRTPWVAAAWSLLTPGLGHLYLHDVVVGLFMVAWTILVMVCSHALAAAQQTLLGHFSTAVRLVDMQWLMYLPSIYGFVTYDAYSAAVELNRLAQKAQSSHLRHTYPAGPFPMPRHRPRTQPD
ncbi:MAG: hypothetical protein K6T30_06510 [Alicyclobacillus sp.]|nr:hypothetical protein [Alicyclobacillus sp.]